MKTLSLIICIFVSFFSFSQQEIQSNKTENKTSFQHSLEMEVLISPNPATDKCRIQGEEGATCTLYSSSGTYIGKWIFDNSNTVMLTDLPSGVLQAVIEKNGLTIIKRIVII